MSSNCSYPSKGGYPVPQPPYQRSEPSSAPGIPAQRPPEGELDQPKEHRRHLLVALLLLPPKIAHTAFALASKLTLSPLRASFGQKIPFTHRKHLVLLPERLEKFMGEMAFLKVRKCLRCLVPFVMLKMCYFTVLSSAD
jgi:hypothetical protein